jgi:hypothetical protein
MRLSIVSFQILRQETWSGGGGARRVLYIMYIIDLLIFLKIRTLNNWEKVYFVSLPSEKYKFAYYFADYF